MSRPLKVAILTVSDTCAADASQDKSGPKLAALFEADPTLWKVEASAISEDSIPVIQKIVRAWADGGDLNLIITSGGTGFAQRDVTPEAIKPLLDKEAPGLVHAMFMKSFAITPLAAMARLVAGVRKSCLIVTVPGSVKGATENAQAILSLLPHACDLASGSSSRALHASGTKKLETETGLNQSVMQSKHGISAAGLASQDPVETLLQHGCGHGHRDQHVHRHHQSNDPTGSVTKRARESPYEMIPFTDALDLIFKHTPKPEKTTLPIHTGSLLTDYIVSKDIYAKEAVPAYRASIVDGYAVLSTDGPGDYPVVSVSHAAPGDLSLLTSGQIARITTGAPLPAGADSVVMVEDTMLVSSTDDGKEEKIVRILESATKDDNIREIGSDVALNSLIMSRGERISGTGGEVGILASAGIQEIEVYRKPVVGVLSTGDELVEPSDPRPLRNGEIRDTNRISLIALIKNWNFPVLDLGIAKDTSGTLETVLASALDACDVVVTTGGVSMGELDLLKPTIERTLNGTIHFGRVALKPGKPTTFATIPHVNRDTHSHSRDATIRASDRRSGDGEEEEEGEEERRRRRGVGKAVFGLPGNPASAIVTFHLFVLPYLRHFSGFTQLGSVLPTLPVRLTFSIPLDPRPEFHRVIVSMTNDERTGDVGNGDAKGKGEGKREGTEDGGGMALRAFSSGGQRSSRVGSMKCNALLRLPPRTSTLQRLEVGETVDAIMIDAIR